MTITEKVSYLKGLVDGLELDPNDKNVKVIKAITDVLNDMAMLMTDYEDDRTELSGQVDEIDEDLAEVEEEVFGPCGDEHCGCGCEDDDEDLYEVTCPTCGEVIQITEEDLDEGSIPCPKCGEELEFDLEDDCGCEGDHCDCGCHENE